MQRMLILLNRFWAITSFTGHFKNFILPFWNSNSFFLFRFLWLLNSQMDQTSVWFKTQELIEYFTRNIHKNDPFPKDSCNSFFNCFQNRFKIKLHSDLKEVDQNDLTFYGSKPQSEFVLCSIDYVSNPS